MKRISIAALTLLLLLTGCGSKEKQQTPTVSLPDNAAEATVPEETAPPRPIAERAAELQAAGEKHIFDEQSVLTDEEKQQYENYLDWLANIRQMSTAVVITDQLGGSTPEQFARDYFETLFGADATGILILINNDTERDYVYATSACAPYIDASLAIAKATPLLVEQQYADALEILLPVGEMVPDRILDRAGALTSEQMQTLCERANALEERRTLLLTHLAEIPDDTAEPTTEETEDTAEETTETEETAEPSEENASDAETEETAETDLVLLPVPEELQALADDVRVKNEADTILVIDVTSGTCALSGEEDGVRDGIQAALQKEGVYAAADYYYKLGE